MIDVRTPRLTLTRFISSLILFVAVLGVSASASRAVDLNEYGIAAVNASLSSTQAGDHPDMSTFVEVRTDPASPADPDGDHEPYAATKDVQVSLPAGLTGNPKAAARCSMLQFATALQEDGGCPADSQVGIAVLHLYGIGGPLYEPIYNLEAPGGDKVARLGFYGYNVPVAIDVKLRSEGDYGLTTFGQNIPSQFPFVSAQVNIWGVPAAHSHDTEKQTPKEVADSGGSVKESPPRKSGLQPEAFLTNPTTCAGPLSVGFAVDSYAAPGDFRTASASLPSITGCQDLDFPTGSSFKPTSSEADSPSGLEALLTMNQSNLKLPEELAPAELRRAVITLPQGVALNPSSADGLTGCSEEQIGLLPGPGIHFQAAPPACPESSKVGSVEIETPVLNGPLKGSLYVATPFANPFNSLLSGYLYAQGYGATIKLAGKFELDQATGRITALFDENPQQPFETIRLRFKEGNQGVLVTPPMCGTYGIDSAFSPWSAADPANPTPAETKFETSTFNIDRGPDGSACPNPPVFTPGFEAGAVTPLAGIYSPLIVKASRPDGSQTLRAIDVKLPPGLTGKLAGISYCPEKNIAGAGQRAGLAEQAASSCPQDSRIGSVTVAAGAGNNPIHVGGAAYLAGPYKGAPLSLVAITPAVAGPFDLGTVIVRTALQVDPTTARIHAVSDQLPTILNGIPLHLRSVVVDANRQEFSRNPTSCEPMSIDATLTGSPDLKSLAERFQVGGCHDLGFKPKLNLRLKGGTKRGAYPTLNATLTARSGDADIKRVSVAMPHSEFLAQEHINTICTRVQFAADQCPKGSVYGRARAFSPLLDKPLEGPVYLRSSNNKLPDLVVALKGQVDVDLAGRIDSVNGGIRTTFGQVPDVPVSKFTLRMKGGKKSLLVNSADICRSKDRATVKMRAHNGRSLVAQPVLKNSGCGKKHKK
jgi:hypothetical protein